MRCHRRRRATRSGPATPIRPKGYGVVRPLAALLLLTDDTASQSSQRLAVDPTPPVTQLRGLLGRAPSQGLADGICDRADPDLRSHMDRESDTNRIAAHHRPVG